MNLVLPDCGGKVNGLISRHDFAALTTAPLMGPTPAQADGDELYRVRITGGLRARRTGGLQARRTGFLKGSRSGS